MATERYTSSSTAPLPRGHHGAPSQGAPVVLLHAPARRHLIVVALILPAGPETRPGLIDGTPSESAE